MRLVPCSTVRRGPARGSEGGEPPRRLPCSRQFRRACMIHPESSRRRITSSIRRGAAAAIGAGLALSTFGGPAQSADPPTRRGDFTADGKLDLTDAVSILNYLFQGGSVPLCLPLGDTDGNGSVDLTDG